MKLLTRKFNSEVTKFWAQIAHEIGWHSGKLLERRFLIVSSIPRLDNFLVLQNESDSSVTQYFGSRIK